MLGDYPATTSNSSEKVQEVAHSEVNDSNVTIRERNEINKETTTFTNEIAVLPTPSVLPEEHSLVNAFFSSFSALLPFFLFNRSTRRLA